MANPSGLPQVGGLKILMVFDGVDMMKSYKFETEKKNRLQDIV